MSQNGYTLTWGVAVSSGRSSSDASADHMVTEGMMPSNAQSSEVQAGTLAAGGSLASPYSSVTAVVASPGIAPAETPRQRLITNDRSFALPRIASPIGYTDILSGAEHVSLAYTVYHNKVEEDIIIGKKGDIRTISMTMHVGSLRPVVQPDGSVDLVDRSDVMQFRVGIPYMMDAEYAVSHDIEVTAEKNGNVCIIRYTPNAAWLDSSKRKYPVLFDPSVTTGEYAANIQDTYVEEAGEGQTEVNHSSEQNLYMNPNGTKHRKAIVRISKLPVIDTSMPIVSAEFQLTCPFGPFEDIPIELHLLNDTSVVFSDYQFASFLPEDENPGPDETRLCDRFYHYTTAQKIALIVAVLGIDPLYEAVEDFVNAYYDALQCRRNLSIYSVYKKVYIHGKR